MSEPQIIVMTAEQMDALVERIAARVSIAPAPSKWLSSKQAAEYLGMPFSTFQKLTAARRIRCQQDSQNGPLYFRPEWLDEWRDG